MRTQKQVGLLIREWRRENRLSQADLADRLGVSQGYVSQMENGEAFSTLSLLVALADLMEISLDELVGRNTNTTHPEPVPDTRTLHRLLDIILETPERDRAKLLSFLEAYTDE